MVRGEGMRQVRHEGGETLVETLLAVMLLGILATGIVGAMASTVTVSDFDAQQSGAETVLRSYAEAWDRTTYATCTANQSTNPYGSTPPSGFTAPSGYTATVSSVTFWNGTSTAPAVFGATCPGGGDVGLQSLALQVTPNRGPAQSLTIQKRKP